MKSLLKITAVAAVALSGSFAQADVTTPANPAGSSLVLFVRDISEGANTNRVYARDLGPVLDSVLAAPVAADPYEGPVQQISYTLPNGGYDADANLQAFFQANPTGNYVWTLMAADASGGAAFNQRYLTTTLVDLAADPGAIPINGAIRGTWSAIAGMYDSLNNSQVLGPSPSSTQVDGLWGQTGSTYSNMIDWNGGGIGNQINLGDTANLYVLVSSAGSTTVGNNTPARVYQGVSVRLTAGGRLESVVATPEVPLPPAIYLLGSAIAALTGVARRRRQGDQARA